MLNVPMLKKGDTIGIFSPSSPVSASCPKRYKRGKAYLESRGFKIKEGSLTGKSDFYRSGSIEERSRELNELIRDKNVRCIMSSIGGMNSNSLLPYIDYEAIKNDPKIFIGYSDVTAILLGIYAKTGITTFYGPALAASFGELPPYVDDTFSYFKDICTDSLELPYTFPTPKLWTEEFLDWENQTRSKSGTPNQLITLHGGKAKGRLIGGNLNTLDGIFGTPYMPKIREGDILFIEDSNKDIAAAERSLSHLKLAGIFHKIGGLIIGKCEHFDSKGSGKTIEDVLTEVNRELSIPVLSRFDCGHTHPMLTLPIGNEVLLDADNQKLTLI